MRPFATAVFGEQAPLQLPAVLGKGGKSWRAAITKLSARLPKADPSRHKAEVFSFPSPAAEFGDAKERLLLLPFLLALANGLLRPARWPD